jgi:hypothetical protein
MKNEELTMSINRISNLFGNDEADSEMVLSGFAVNPVGNAVAPAQANIYQAAFMQAWKALQEPVFPDAELWS